MSDNEYYKVTVELDLDIQADSAQDAEEGAMEVIEEAFYDLHYAARFVSANKVVEP